MMESTPRDRKALRFDPTAEVLTALRVEEQLVKEFPLELNNESASVVEWRKNKKSRVTFSSSGFPASVIRSPKK